MDSITACVVVLCFILLDVVSSLAFDFAVPDNQKDCLGRESLAAQAITWTVLSVFAVDLALHAIAEGRAYLCPFHLSNTCDVAIVSISVGVAAFQTSVDASIPANDAEGRYLPPSAGVTEERYPALCANFTSSGGGSSAGNTQTVFTAIRAARIVARIALALRILRAAVRITKMARLLGGGKPKVFAGHRQMVTDVLIAPPLPEEEAGGRPPSAFADRYRLFTASGDSTVMMYDMLSDNAAGRSDAVGQRDQTASV
jgi:hypothetical protein